MFRVEKDHGFGRLVGFPNLHRRGKMGGENGKTLGLQGFHDFLGMFRPGRELIDHDALHMEIVVVVALDISYMLTHVVNRVPCKGVAVKGDKAPRGRNQGRLAEEIQCGGRVDEHGVEPFHGIQGFAKFVDFMLVYKLGFDFNKGRMGGNHPQVVVGGFMKVMAEIVFTPIELREKRVEREDASHIKRGFEIIVDGFLLFPGRFVLFVHQVTAGVPLRIQIDHEGLFPALGADRRQIARNGSFTHASFFIEDHPTCQGFLLILLNLMDKNLP